MGGKCPHVFFCCVSIPTFLDEIDLRNREQSSSITYCHLPAACDVHERIGVGCYILLHVLRLEYVLLMV